MALVIKLELQSVHSFCYFLIFFLSFSGIKSTNIYRRNLRKEIVRSSVFIIHNCSHVQHVKRNISQKEHWRNTRICSWKNSQFCMWYMWTHFKRPINAQKSHQKRALRKSEISLVRLLWTNILHPCMKRKGNKNIQNHKKAIIKCFAYLKHKDKEDGNEKEMKHTLCDSCFLSK